MHERTSLALLPLLWCVASIASAASPPSPPSLAELLRPSEHTFVAMSPGGDYIAATRRLDDRVVLAIIDRRTNALVRVLDPQEDGAVDRIAWAGDRRLFLMNSRVGNTVQESYLEAGILAVDVDGKRRRSFHADIVDTLLGDQERILVSICGKSSTKGCWNHVQESDNDGSRAGRRIADAPMLDASFLSDQMGAVRFAHGRDDDDVQQSWMLDDGNWTQLNDEATSGVEVVPLGVSRDGLSGFLRSQRKAGPDVIERVTFATGTREVVMSDPDQDPVHLVWSVDGTQPIGAAYGRGVPRARFWNPDDPDARLIRLLEAAFPEDAVAVTSGSRDARHAVVTVWGDRDPGSYYLFDRDSKRSALMVRAKPWLDPGALAPARPVDIPTRDGGMLDGYLTIPLRGTSPPLVVMPHGGPFGIRDGWDYDEEVQVLAARGYAVLRVNFRGSAGRGRAFIEAGYRQWGGLMQDDLTDATRWALANGHGQAGRTCLWGSSYGGYAALMGAVRAPELYQCVVATAAVTDLNLMRSWGDIKRSRSGRRYLERAVGDDPKRLLEASPVAHAGRIRAQVLMIHGKRDQRVSFEHAKAMLAAFDKAGKAVDHDFFRNETHGIWGDENRMSYYTQVLDFLDSHIGPQRPDRAPAADAEPLAA
ncbi:MAG TPA: alpha/beta fold hydrolase, partial [Luteimonas sp.]|nr:alpha/beta fold hydrolase [Luteimonas sp.]